MPKPKVKLFSFPWKDADLCKIWLDFCQRDNINVKAGMLNKIFIDFLLKFFNFEL